MEREPIPGECVRVTRNTGDHGAKVGDLLTVCNVDDSDNTIRGIPRGFDHVADFWIPWSDIEPVAFGWEYASGHLPSDVLRLLSVCDGVQHLALNRQIKNEIFDSLPDWRERVMEVLGSIDPESL
ncbi:MAG: hypothetical protein ACKO4T_13605 [Planctomycetaceae bacterium]